MNTAAKLLEVLRLFASEAPVWRVERIAAVLRVSQSTAYRYVAQLVRTGFLDPVASGGYVLGPTFVELDRRIRMSDPLLRAALPEIAKLRKLAAKRAGIVLTRYYRDCVMCIHSEYASADAPKVSYERGLPMSLFRGATSKAILASLPDRVLRRLYRAHASEVAAAGMGRDWKAFSGAFRQLRGAECIVTRSEVSRGRLGIAAPIVADDAVLGSLSLVVPERDLTEAETKQMSAAIVRAAGRISKSLARDNLGKPRLVARGGRVVSSGSTPPAA